MNLLGEYRHTIDAKNRLFIPAKFREELGNEFFITRKTETCLLMNCCVCCTEKQAITIIWV